MKIFEMKAILITYINYFSKIKIIEIFLKLYYIYIFV